MSETKAEQMLESDSENYSSSFLGLPSSSFFPFFSCRQCAHRTSARLHQDTLTSIQGVNMQQEPQTYLLSTDVRRPILALGARPALLHSALRATPANIRPHLTSSGPDQSHKHTQHLHTNTQSTLSGQLPSTPPPILRPPYAAISPVAVHSVAIIARFALDAPAVAALGDRLALVLAEGVGAWRAYRAGACAHTHRQTQRQTDRQTDRDTETQRHRVRHKRRSDAHTDKRHVHTCGHAYRQKRTHTDARSHRQTHGQTDT
eukprot:300873-Rhodomonas_salina.1